MSLTISGRSLARCDQSESYGCWLTLRMRDCFGQALDQVSAEFVHERLFRSPEYKTLSPAGGEGRVRGQTATVACCRAPSPGLSCASATLSRNAGEGLGQPGPG